MNTRSKSRNEQDGIKKFALVAFPDPPESCICNIGNVEKPKKKLPGSTIRVKADGKWRKGTIVSTSDKSDNLLTGLQTLNVPAFFGIRKRKVFCEAASKKKRTRDNIQEPEATPKKQKVDVKTEVPKKTKRSQIPIPLHRRKQPPSSKTYTGFKDLPEFSPIPVCLSPIHSIPPSSAATQGGLDDILHSTISTVSQVSLSPIYKLAEITSGVLDCDLPNLSIRAGRTFSLDAASSVLKKNLEQRLEEIRPRNSHSYSDYINLESPNQDLSRSYAEEGSPEMSSDLSPLIEPKLSSTHSTKSVLEVKTPTFGYPFLQESIPTPPIPYRDFGKLAIQSCIDGYVPYSNNSPAAVIYPFVYSMEPTLSRMSSCNQSPFYPVSSSADTLTHLYPNATSTPAFQGPPCMYQSNSYQQITPVHRLAEAQQGYASHEMYVPQSSTPIFNTIPQQPMNDETPIIHPECSTKSSKISITHTTTPTNLVAVFQEQLNRSNKMDTAKSNENPKALSKEPTEMNPHMSARKGPKVMSTISHPKLLKLRPVQIHVKNMNPDYLQQCIDQIPDESESSPHIFESQVILDALLASKSKPEVFARELMGRMFTLEEIRNRNVSGISRRNRPIGPLDPIKIATIKKTVESYFPSSFFAWKFCVLKMNEYIGNTFKKLNKYDWLKID